MTYDCLILGCGPAGLSAALQCARLGRSALVIGNPPDQNPLARAPLVDNYLGLPGLSGQALLDAFVRHARQCDGVQFITGRALSALSYGGLFSVSVGAEVYQGRCVILACGVARTEPFPGEARLLGKGVSYCAACDAMLYRGRAVAVLGLAQDAPQEAGLLERVGCRVTYLAPRRPEGLAETVAYRKTGRVEILGEDRVSGVSVDGRALPFDGVFVLRDTVAPQALFPGLPLEGGYIRVDRSMATGLPGVFACGDCTGLPHQIAKAVGEGQVAGHSAAQWLERQDTQKDNR